MKPYSAIGIFAGTVITGSLLADHFADEINLIQMGFIGVIQQQKCFIRSVSKTRNQAVSCS